ncbi:alpha/beta hydrolase [Mariniflexile sp. AS56]|uniref:alpha/beta hydrolase n=1 Tax=Mariniflexile sp. AS56 TaxID=3063957 RepID=UPI0026E96593|nr:alpha/beta hydrolase-fold protein [Mariniflexile sp. AS56]MDO7173723.1 alpha/beta hydrolase-fold protein [Mariniflexile sp. AS56]
MKKLIIIFQIVFIVFGVQAQTKEPFNIGEIVKLESKILNEERILNIYIPESYKMENSKQYPVIYLIDGSADEDFIHISGLVQYCSFSWIDIISESIVVGIANIDRQRDFTFPTTNEEDKKDFPTTGGSENFIKFIESEVKPLIKTNYRINDESTLIGQSFGGLLATEILLKSPQLFDNFIIVSPALWWDDRSLLKLSVDKIKAPKNIYIAVGEEGPTMEGTALQLISKLQTLRRRELEKTLVIRYEFLKQYNHGNILHSAVYNAFMKFKEVQNINNKN